MISPSTQTRRGTPKFFRGLLAFFVVRHVLGIALFFWLDGMAWNSGPPFSYVMLALTVAYAAYAAHNTRKIYAQYQSSVRRQKQEGGIL